MVGKPSSLQKGSNLREGGSPTEKEVESVKTLAAAASLVLGSVSGGADSTVR
jgi:hypothetical protein